MMQQLNRAKHQRTTQQSPLDDIMVLGGLTFSHVKAPACQQPSQILIAKCEFSHGSFSLES